MTAAELTSEVSMFSGEIHPFAARFPMLPDEELAELAADIAANGLLNPILLSDEGMLLDGRNRLAACGLVGVRPVFDMLGPGINPVAIIVSANVRRRQMMPGQVAMAAGIGLAEQGKRRDGRWKRDSIPNPDIGIIAKTWQNQMQHVGIVLDYDADRGTDYADRVLTGALTLNEAYGAVMKARNMERAAQEAAEDAKQEAAAMAEQAASKFEALRAGAPDLAELVRTEKLTLDDATAAWDNRRKDELAARQVALGAWIRACDGLTSALSYLAGGFRPPADLPASHITLTEFTARATQIIELLEGTPE